MDLTEFERLAIDQDHILKEIEMIESMSDSEVIDYLAWLGAIKYYKDMKDIKEQAIARLMNSFNKIENMLCEAN